MKRSKFTRTGVRRSGDDYQDVIAINVMVEMLEHPDRYQWLQVEANAKEIIKTVGVAMRILLRSKLTTSQAIQRIREELGDSEEISYLIEFLESSERGLITSLPGRQGSRGE